MRYKSQAQIEAEKRSKVDIYEKVKAAAALCPEGQWTVNQLFSTGFGMRLRDIATFDARVYKNVVRLSASKYTNMSHLSISLEVAAPVEELGRQLLGFAHTVITDRHKAETLAKAKADSHTTAIKKLQKIDPSTEKSGDKGFRLTLPLKPGFTYRDRKGAGTFTYNYDAIQDLTLYDLTFEQAKKILAIITPTEEKK